MSRSLYSIEPVTGGFGITHRIRITWTLGDPLPLVLPVDSVMGFHGAHHPQELRGDWLIREILHFPDFENGQNMLEYRASRA